MMMESNPIDLTICQVCKSAPAIYGDGLTWSRCAKCEREQRSQEGQIPEQQEPVVDAESGFAHEIVKGLTSIILPVYMKDYALFHYTGNCLGAVREHTPEGIYEIVVVDNGSPLQPPTMDSYYAQRVVKSETNMGVTKAWNQGIRVSVGEYIVLLNNDVQVFDHWLEDMKKALDEDGYSLVMAHPMYSQTEPFARAIESRNIRTKVLESGKKYSEFKDFSCVMFKRSLIDEIGGFDELFFNYCSDSDFFKRMEMHSKTWACCEHVPTSHLSDATGYSIAETPQLMDEDKKRYAEKWDPKPGVPETAEKLTEELPTPVQVRNEAKFVARIENGGDPIYFVDMSSLKMHHVKDPDALHALGFNFGDEAIMPKEDLGKFEFGEEITKENAQIYA
jgi:hypothetical protein